VAEQGVEVVVVAHGLGRVLEVLAPRAAAGQAADLTARRSVVAGLDEVAVVRVVDDGPDLTAGAVAPKLRKDGRERQEGVVPVGAAIGQEQYVPDIDVHT
jgi:hypothetical protein